jgi:caffeoyl-CoA O-methyltransferase
MRRAEGEAGDRKKRDRAVMTAERRCGASLRTRAVPAWTAGGLAALILFLTVFVACTAPPPSEPPPLAAGTAPDEEAVMALLREIKASDEAQLAISEEDGRFLRLLVAATGAQRVLEIGGASGYSAIWMGMGLRQTGGRLFSIEYDETRAREAVENVRRAGLAHIISVIRADAFEEIPRLPGTFDVIFLDAWKPDYGRFFDLAFPRLEPGGLLLAHNVVNKAAEMPDFLEAIHTHPGLWTGIVSPSGEGLSMSYRVIRPGGR